jgi:hypothetical protein
MKKVFVLAEGQTEERFIKNVLYKEYIYTGICFIPVILSTGKTKMGNKFRGGVSTYSKIRDEVLKLLNDSSAAAVTTFMDYYALPEDFPGKENLASSDCYSRVDFLEKCFMNDIRHRRFIPFLMLHEFETMLFSDVDKLAGAFHYKGNSVYTLNEIINKYPNIEEINDGSATHPSKRIKDIYSDYMKSIHGPVITGRIGLDVIRNKCRHFNQWLTSVESI